MPPLPVCYLRIANELTVAMVTIPSDNGVMTNANKEIEVDYITVADMIAALSALPADARLVVTESGYYSYGEFAEIMLPEVYNVENDMTPGGPVYRIGHSHQSY